MSSRATAAAYAPQQPVSGAGKDNYTAMPSSYGRQPMYESPVIPDYDPTTTSHAAGDVGSLGRYQFSMRRYDERLTNNPLPPLRTDALAQPRAQAPADPPGRRYASDPISATSSLSPTSVAIRKGSASHDSRRGPVLDRSPLQRLEVMTKEEKRARLLEAENAANAARERSAKSKPPNGRADEAIGRPRGKARDIPPESSRAPDTSTADPIRQRPHVREKPAQPNGYKHESRSADASRSPPDDSGLGFAPEKRFSQGQRPFRYDGGYHAFSDPISQNGTHRRRSDAPSVPATDFTPNRGVLSPPLRGSALAGGAADAWQYPTESIPPADVGFPSRAGSKRLHKYLPQENRFSGSWHQESTPVGHQQTDQAPPQNPRSVSDSGPSYSHPSPRKVVGFNQGTPEVIPNATDGKGHRRLSKMIGLSHHDDMRSYQPGPNLDEWRNTGTARLADEDLNLDAVPAPSDDSDKVTPWWEKSATQRRRSSRSKSQPATTTFDASYDERSGQSCFSPPLYLKCGPLLRFRGIHKEPGSATSQGAEPADQETWRGSIMIVTIDAKSAYNPPPTLRLFKQPVDLLPPPPARIDASSGQPLAPEYIDPVAGQIKMSRVGKTLYVKPVELLEEGRDLSRIEDDNGLFEEKFSGTTPGNTYANTQPGTRPNITGARSKQKDGEKVGKVVELPGTRLHAERGVTFWKFNIEIHLGQEQMHIAYRINRGPAVGFWVPARRTTMNMMFHSCNGFSMSVNPHDFSGPDPLWRDVLNTHQTRPFHVMIGGGDQVYMDLCSVQTTYFREWTEHKNPHYKSTAPFTEEMQDELEAFYLNRYSMWFSQGLFGMATSQIPMVNIWDDHDIIDGYGSYPHHTMDSPVFSGIGAVAFKYYMLFQHQSIAGETAKDEPSWLLGAKPGPYIHELGRSVFMSMGNGVAFLGLDCRTERTRDEILCDGTWDLVFQRCDREIVQGETKHLIVLLGVPIAYPRLNFLENVLTSRAMDPIKAIGRSGVLGGFVNKFDGGVEILDDLDDHWTAKHHKKERNRFIQELQELAAEKSVRITILGGDVHLAAIGRFYSNKKLSIPKDRDHRYMPNIISSAIVNTPPGDMLANVLNRRNKVHHLDDDTDEDMIAMFPHDVDGKPRHNTHLLPHRNWCSIREYHPGTTPPPTPPTPDVELPEAQPDVDIDDDSNTRPSGLRRTFSLGRRSLDRPRTMLRRMSGGAQHTPPISYYNAVSGQRPQQQQRRASSDDALLNRPREDSNSSIPAASGRPRSAHVGASSDSSLPGGPRRLSAYHRRPTGLTAKQEAELANDERGGHIDLSGGLDIRLNVENVRGDPAGTTTEYRLLIPALDYQGPPDENVPRRRGNRVRNFFAKVTDRRTKYSPDASPAPSPPASDAGIRASESTTSFDALGSGGDRSHVQALGGQNKRLQAQLAHQSDPLASSPTGVGPPPGAEARAEAINALPVSTTAPTQSPSSPAQDPNLYPAVTNPVPMRSASHRRSKSKPQNHHSYAPSGSVPEPSATVSPPTRIADDGRPLRRRYRPESYDEDTVIPSAAVPAGKNESRWSDENDEEGPAAPPSQQRWSSPPRGGQEEKRGRVLRAVRRGVSGWRPWKM